MYPPDFDDTSISDWKPYFKKWDDEERNKPLFDKNNKEIKEGDTVAISRITKSTEPPSVYKVYMKDGLFMGKTDKGEIALWIYNKSQRTILYPQLCP